ncbi:MAG: LPP20 family lipoprotein [Prevotella sp.]|nr:LPP20 family lipoprotein [Prevotella sp.]
MNKLFSQFFMTAILLHFFSVGAFSQALTSKEWKKLRESDDCIIGMGMSESMDHARQVAMSDLVSKISTKVISRFEYLITNQGNKMSDGQMEKIIKTYSSMRLDNVSEYMEKDHGEFVIYRYITKSDLSTMFKRRVNMAKKWAKEAVEREREGKIGDALQDYYWSLALLRSCPDGDLETISNDYDEQNMMIDINRRVNSILENISIKAIDSEKDGQSQRMTLKIDYKGKPAANFNYKYSDGKTSSVDVFTAKDGIGDLLVPLNAKLKRLKIRAEYEFRDEANIQPELRDVLESLDPVPFRQETINVDTRDCPISQSSDYTMAIVGGGTFEKPSTGSMGQVNSEPTFASTMKAIQRGIATKDYSNLEGYFTAEGWDMFNKLVRYGDAKLLGSAEVQFLPSEDGMVCRSFPMSFAFKGNKRVFKEDVVFYMDSSGKVNEVAFGLEEAAVNDIMNRGGSDWNNLDRQVIIHFLETYKTAYALKRLDYLKTVFSKYAVIITGSVVKATKQAELAPSNLGKVKYTRQTKDQYMKNLEKCFHSNEYVNIHFADNIMRRSANDKKIYGIQIKQDYYSSSYGDTGYLFLMIDFKNPKAPLITVRTWQPDDNPNVKDGRIDMTHFRFD